MQAQAAENKLLREANNKLETEKTALKLLIMEHMKRCPDAEDLRKYCKLCYILFKIRTFGETVP